MIRLRELLYCFRAMIFESCKDSKIREGVGMETAIFIIGGLVFWFVMSKWVLPKLGIPT
jgi:hypothetical protein